MVELQGFDLENVVGAPCTLNVVHKQGSKGGTFSNIAGIMPLAKGFSKLEPRDYVRIKDREPAPMIGRISLVSGIAVILFVGLLIVEKIRPSGVHRGANRKPTP